MQLKTTLYRQEVGALGHNDKTPYFIPKKVDFFKEEGLKVDKIAAGMYHSVCVTEDGNLFTWGKGLYGALGNGSNQYNLTPLLNEEFKALKEEGINILKIDSAEDYTGALMDNGELLMFGKNDRGQLGIGEGTGMDMIESSVFPNPLIVESREFLPVKNFASGMNMQLVLGEDNKYYKVGNRLHWYPKV